MRKYIYIILCAALTALFSCANPIPPSGGPGDKTPPSIKETSPAAMAKNFNGNSVEIEFSNYMDKNKVIENVTIFPYVPALYDWSGKTLNIEFTEQLKPNTTYAILFGTDYTDYLKNKPTQGYSLVFSTGNSIDSGEVKGKLLDEKPSGIYIFCYRIDNINPDTLNLRLTKPDYRVQIGTSGLFTIPALSRGKYRIFSVTDELRDGIYTEGQDAIGTAPEDASVGDSAAMFITLHSGRRVDKLRPSMYYAEALNSFSVRADFSEPLDTASVTAASFALTDSAGIDTLPIRYAYLSNEAAQRVTLITRQELAQGKKYRLTALTGRYCAKDTAGNPVSDSARSAFFIGTADRDSSQLTIVKQSFRDSVSGLPLDASIDFVFSAPIAGLDSIPYCELIRSADSARIPFRREMPRANHLRIVPEKRMESHAAYKLSLRMAGIQSANGQKAKDSTIVLKWRTQDLRANSEVYGSVRFIVDSSKSYIIRITSKDGKYSSETRLRPDGTWAFPSVPAGMYRFRCFEDVNQDGKFFSGSIEPYRTSARMIDFRSEIKVPLRWKVENVILAE